MKLDDFLQKLISWLFVALFFLAPLFFTSVNSELFEFNKIILVYAFSALIAGAWVSRMILQKRILFKKTFFDIPLSLFLISQFSSTLLSIDRHTSLFGYYSRFNGGLLSTVSYLLLYWSFVSNCEIKDVKRIIKFSLVSAVIISIYGILEHFGHSFSCLMFLGNFDVSCWVQKVQERVFATLGQPNWLAAYLVVLTPLSWWLSLSAKCKVQSAKLQLKAKSFLPYVLFIFLFSCLLFTQSRSGFLGFLLSFAVFWGIIFFQNRANVKPVIKLVIGHWSLVILLIFLFGSPFPQINKYFTLNSWQNKSESPTSYKLQATSSSEDGGISASSDIRKIVWKGAFDIFKHYPLFGSGVETFAYSYYQFRPMEHNLVSEWDFLYNKAHNEYLNYLSTTGILGLGTYLIFTVSFAIYSISRINPNNFRIHPNINSIRNNSDTIRINSGDNYLIFALLSGWLSLLITNFFGFSVVLTSLYFFLIPAFIVVLLRPQPSQQSVPSPKFLIPNSYKVTPLLLIPLFFTFYLLHFTFNLWSSDYYYNKGLKLSRQGNHYDAYQNYYKAISQNPREPVFLSEASVSLANLAILSNEQKDASGTADLINLSVDYSNKAENYSPANLNFQKSRVKVYYSLSLLKPEYLNEAIRTIEEAIKMAPTDPKLVYNLGLLLGKQGKAKEAIAMVEKAVEMKPNYVDARNALSVFYEDLGQKEKALEQLRILIRLAPENKSDFEKRIDKIQQ